MDRSKTIQKLADKLRYDSLAKYKRNSNNNKMSDGENDIVVGRSFGGSMRRSSAGGLSNTSGGGQSFHGSNAGSAKGLKSAAVDEWDDNVSGEKVGNDRSSGGYGGFEKNRSSGDRYGGGDRNGGYKSRDGGNRDDGDRRGGGGGGFRDRNGDGGDRRGGGGGFRDRNGDGGDRRGGGGGFRDRNGEDGERRGGGGFRDRNGDDGDRRGGGGGFRDRNGDDGDRRGGGGGFRDRNGDGGDRRGGGGGYHDRNGDDENRRGRGDDGDEPQKPREFYIPPEPTEDEDEMFKSGISSGINFDKYDKIPIKVSGKDAPEQITSFEDGGLRSFVLENIKKSGYLKPTPIQKTAIPIIMAGRDLMACAQTGSGKTAAFLVPIINRLLMDTPDMSVGKPHVLIVSPTRELSIQIYNEARKFAMGSYLKVAIVYGGTSSKHQSEKVSKGCHILICTPGRLLDFVDRDFIRFEDTRFVVLDEADRMLDMGFVEPVRRVMNHETMRSPDQRQTLMFSATFPEEIQRLAGEFLNNYIFVTIGVVGGACADVVQTIFDVPKTAKRTKLLDILNVSAEGVLVFVETKRQADFLASMCSESGFPTTSIHGDRLQSQREQALADFKSGKMKVLIATSVAARGLDIKNIAHVVNYDLPSSIDDFVHRIGRTGRVGNDGRATSFFSPESDGPLAPELVRVLQGAGQEVPDFLLQYASGSSNIAPRSSNNRFGGRDVRQNNHDNETNAPAALEEDENWE